MHTTNSGRLATRHGNVCMRVDLKMNGLTKLLQIYPGQIQLLRMSKTEALAKNQAIQKSSNSWARDQQ